MVALVTGAGGFIGAQVAGRLEGDGRRVLRAGRPELEIPSPAFTELVERAEPELVVHCATPASVAASVAEPGGDRRGSVGVLDALLELLEGLPRVPRLVFVSSAAVYGQPQHLPVAEDHPLAPVSPYGEHRMECERLLLAHSVPFASLRVFSAYGEGLRRQVLWDICQKALDGSVELSGTGDETRDFVHVSDVASAVAVAAARAPFGGEAFNVGTGHETAIRDLAGALIAALGVEAALTFSGRKRPGDPDRWRADPARLGALGWQPAVNLEDGAATYARWARSERARASA